MSMSIKNCHVDVISKVYVCSHVCRYIVFINHVELVGICEDSGTLSYEVMVYQ